MAHVTDIGLVIDSSLSFIDEADLSAPDTGVEADWLGLVVDSPYSHMNVAAIDRADMLPKFTLAASTNIAPSDGGIVLDSGYVSDGFLDIDDSGDLTTFQLNAPSGKTTANFGGGRIQDEINPGLPVDIAADTYREDEFCIKATTDTVTGEIYEFRCVVGAAQEYDTYTFLPEWTIAAATYNLIQSRIIKQAVNRAATY